MTAHYNESRSVGTRQPRCRVGQVWRYAAGGYAAIISVTPFDFAPQCEAILLDNVREVKSTYQDGTMRGIGIMERELVEYIGEWAPIIKQSAKGAI